MMMLMTSLLSGEGDTFFSASPPVSNGRNCCWNIFMSASSPSAFLRPTPKHTFVSTSTTQQQSPRAIEKRRKKERGKTNSLSCSPVFTRTTFSSNSRGHERNSIGAFVQVGAFEKRPARSRSGVEPGAIVSKFPSRRLNAKIFACASKIRAHARGAKENTNQRYSFFSPPRRPLSSRIEFLASFIHRLW